MSSMRQLIPIAFQVTSNVAPDLSAKVACELFLRPRRLPLSTREREILQQAQTETLQSSRRVYFWGENVQDPLVAFVHGWESRGSAFHKWIPLLIENGFRVMGWDGPAHGESPGVRTTAPDIAQALAADLSELNVPLHGVVGHSLGGVVVGLLSRHISLPQKVVIVSAPSRISGVFSRYNDQIRLSRAARARFQRMIERETGITAEEGSLINQKIPELAETLLIHDVDDREVPFSDFQELRQAWDQARALATQGLGHRRILRDLSVGHEITEFLKSS